MTRGLKFWLAVILLPFVLLTLSEIQEVTDFLRYNPPFTLPEFAQIVGALGTFILTGGLLYLYFRQTQILNEERKQTEFEAQALLRVEDFQIVSPSEVEDHVKEADIQYWDHLAHADLVEIEISNFGRAPADELRIEAMLHGEEHGWEAQGPLVKGDWKTAVERMTARPMDVIRLNDTGAAIGTDERNVIYTTSIHALSEEIEEQWDIELPIDDEMDSEVSTYLSASEILWYLQDLGEEEIDAGIRLWYQDGTGQREPVNLQFATAESPKLSDFETAVLRGRPMMPNSIQDHEKWWG